MTTSTTLPAVQVDFNEVYDDDHVWASVRRTPGLNVADLGSGEWVRLTDVDGASCLAIVDDMTGPILTCKIDWSTWRSVRTEFELSWHILPATLKSLDFVS